MMLRIDWIFTSLIKNEHDEPYEVVVEIVEVGKVLNISGAHVKITQCGDHPLPTHLLCNGHVYLNPKADNFMYDGGDVNAYRLLLKTNDILP